MKSGNLLLGLMACAAMCACTDNDIANGGGGNGSQVFEGDVAYMVVNIKEVGSAATKATSSGFSVGTENDVKDIHFYFYYDNGELATVSTPTTWTDGTAGDEGDNIEISGKRVVALRDLAEMIYPSYMVTVINQPSDFGSPATLEAMRTTLVSANGVIGTDYFTMSTSSYYEDIDKLGTDNQTDHDAYYFATPVSENNFTTNESDINDANSDYFTNKAVTVYVERLAAKVELLNGISGGESIGDLGLGDGSGGKIVGDYSVGGETKSTITRATVTSCYKISSQAIFDVDDGTISSSEQDLYIHFDKWALNATAKQSYMMKNIDSSWDSSEWSGWSIVDEDNNNKPYWNDPSNKRSYWGMSFNYVNYGDKSTYTYPTSSSEINEDTDCLDYIPSKSINYTIGSDAYCAENTNTAGGENGFIQSKNSPAITSILVLATVYDKDASPLDLVKYDSQLYTEKAYLTLACQIINDIHPIYLGSNVPSSGTLTQAYVGLKDRGDGYVKVYITGGSDDTSGTTYSYYDENGTLISNPQELIDNIFNDVYGKYANWYKDGQMYYNVPIEHLNDKPTVLEEAQYGVVRNHYYVVTLNSVSDLGRGINNPDDPIIPQEEPELYYLGAEVQILSWRLVSQSVDL